MESLHNNDVRSNFVEESNQEDEDEDEDEHEHEHEHAIGNKREINEASVKVQDAMNLAKQWELEIAQDLETRTTITCTSTTSSNNSEGSSTSDSRTLERGNQRTVSIPKYVSSNKWTAHEHVDDAKELARQWDEAIANEVKEDSEIDPTDIAPNTSLRKLYDQEVQAIEEELLVDAASAEGASAGAGAKGKYQLTKTVEEEIKEGEGQNQEEIEAQERLKKANSLLVAFEDDDSEKDVRDHDIQKNDSGVNAKKIVNLDNDVDSMNGVRFGLNEILHLETPSAGVRKEDRIDQIEMNDINSDASKQHTSMLAYEHENEHEHEHEQEDKKDEEYEAESFYEQTNQITAEEMRLTDEARQIEMDHILHARSLANEAKAKSQIVLTSLHVPTSTFSSNTVKETANPGIICLKPTESTSAAGESLSGDEHANTDNALAHLRDRTNIYSRDLGVSVDACADPNDEYLNLFITTSGSNDDHVSCLHVHSKSFDEDDNNRYINGNFNSNDNLGTFQDNNNSSNDTIASEIQMMQAILLAERASKKGQNYFRTTEQSLEDFDTIRLTELTSELLQITEVKKKSNARWRMRDEVWRSRAKKVYVGTMKKAKVGTGLLRMRRR